MSTLSKKEHWDSIHAGEEKRISRSRSKRAAQTIKRLLGSAVLERTLAYDEHLLWNVIFPRYLPELRGAKVVEVGSAPGEFLVQFSRKYGTIPYGVEYSEVGVEVNRTVFTSSGFDPENVFHCDFFSDEFLDRYKGQFDVVVSRGFIEHFDDVRPVVDRHMDLLAPGGYLIVTVPNLRGVNKPLAHFFDKKAIPRHNLDIMRKPAFTSLFERDNLERLFCDYYGTFSFYLFTADESSVSRRALKIAHRLQPLLNLSFRTLLGNKGSEGGMCSPSLLFIGRKKQAAGTSTAIR